MKGSSGASGTEAAPEPELPQEQLRVNLKAGVADQKNQ